LSSYQNIPPIAARLAEDIVPRALLAISGGRVGIAIAPIGLETTAMREALYPDCPPMRLGADMPLFLGASAAACAIPNILCVVDVCYYSYYFNLSS
jgi:hypothetical protein